jgi:hypothetical protein
VEFSIGQIEAPSFPDFSRLSQLAKSCNGPRFISNRNLCAAQTKLAMSPKSELIHQRKVTRVVKGAIAGGFHVSTVKVDKDGAIVLYSNTQEREECEEPRLPLKANEWDEVLKK